MRVRSATVTLDCRRLMKTDIAGAYSRTGYCSYMGCVGTGNYRSTSITLAALTSMSLCPVVRCFIPAIDIRV